MNLLRVAANRTRDRGATRCKRLSASRPRRSSRRTRSGSPGRDPGLRGAAHPPVRRCCCSASSLVVLAYPFLDASTGGRAVLGVVQMVVVFAAVAAVRLHPRADLGGAAARAAGHGLRRARGGPAATPTGSCSTSAAVHAPFYFYVSYAMIRYLFHDDRVTRDELFATGAAFTVVAWAFAYVYAAAQVLWPGSFVGADGAASRSGSACSSCPSPTSPASGSPTCCRSHGHARSLVMVEQVAGVLYVALVDRPPGRATVVRASERALTPALSPAAPLISRTAWRSSATARGLGPGVRVRVEVDHRGQEVVDLVRGRSRPPARRASDACARTRSASGSPARSARRPDQQRVHLALLVAAAAQRGREARPLHVVAELLRANRLQPAGQAAVPDAPRRPTSRRRHASASVVSRVSLVSVVSPSTVTSSGTPSVVSGQNAAIGAAVPDRQPGFSARPSPSGRSAWASCATTSR